MSSSSSANTKRWFRKILYYGRIVLIIAFFVGAFAYAPFSPIPNGFNTPTTKIETFGRIDFPEEFVYQHLPNNKTFVGCVHTADLTFILSGDEIVSGKVLDVLITMNACRFIVNNTRFVIARMENSQEAGYSSLGPINALVNMELREPTPQFNNFVGTHKIRYGVSGTFTATVIFVHKNGTESEYPTGALFPIESPEIIIARQNQALTTSLSFIVLAFAVIEIRIKKYRNNGSSSKKDSKPSDQKREQVKSVVRLIEPEVAANEHAEKVQTSYEKETEQPQTVT